MATSTSFRPLTSDDLPLLADWLGRPHVERWWREAADLKSVRCRYGPLIEGSDPSEAFLWVVDGEPIGYVQRYLLDDNPEWRAAVAPGLGHAVGAGIDYLIGVETLIGKGLGRRMITDFVSASWLRYPAIGAVIAAVQQDNVASWRALEGAGFHRAWTGNLESEDPSDAGPSYLYRTRRPG